MLREFTHVRQIPDEGFRRLFTDENFDLFVWYEDASERRILGFQLCYDKRGRQKALTWYARGGYLHAAVDDGEGSPLKNRTPVLVDGEGFPKERVAREFREAGKNLEPVLLELVETRIEGFPVRE